MARIDRNGSGQVESQVSGQVAQSVERSPEKAGVGGSIPSLATTFSTIYGQSVPTFIPFHSKTLAHGDCLNGVKCGLDVRRLALDSAAFPDLGRRANVAQKFDRNQYDLWN